jgi:urease accessory protein
MIMGTTTITAMTITPRIAAPFDAVGRPAPAALTTLMAWFSPAFPTGAFAYSHGLEAAVAEDKVRSETELLAWLEGVLNHGAGWGDAVLMACAHRAAQDLSALLDLADLTAALAPSAERLAESLGQGEAFIIAVRGAWPSLLHPGLPDRLSQPVAAGAATGALGIEAETALIAYLNGFTTNMIAAAIRLSVCGQSAAARLLAALGSSITDLAARAARATRDDLGGCAFGSDIAAMRHETLNGRLFLS